MKQQKRREPETTFEGIPQTSLMERWGKVSPLLVRALETGPRVMGLLDVFNALQRREMQLWAAFENDFPVVAAVTQLVNWPQARACEILLLAGDHREKWIEFEQVISEWAESEGCDHMQITGRAGWERVLKDHGWTRSAVQLMKGIAE
tara:strand:- start:1055 stop:1498 length:444 start_codon:yes stop_codon:yes gene_type:complete